MKKCLEFGKLFGHGLFDCWLIFDDKTWGNNDLMIPKKRWERNVRKWKRGIGGVRKLGENATSFSTGWLEMMTKAPKSSLESKKRQRGLQGQFRIHLPSHIDYVDKSVSGLARGHLDLDIFIWWWLASAIWLIKFKRNFHTMPLSKERSKFKNILLGNHHVTVDEGMAK